MQHSTTNNNSNNTRRSRRQVVYISMLLVCAVVVRSFCGIYRDDEFGSKHFFVKHKPSWKFSFRSPRSMGDTSLDEMPESSRVEQVMYDEYVNKRLWEFPLSW